MSPDPATLLALAEGETVPAFSGPWVCFHCGEVCETREEAEEHFGDYGEEAPVCVFANGLFADMSEAREMVLQQRELWRDLIKRNHEVEQAEFLLHNFEYVARKLTGKPSAGTHDLEFEWESMEGRVLAAESALRHAPRWAAAWLRRRAERIETRALRARSTTKGSSDE